MTSITLNYLWIFEGLVAAKAQISSPLQFFSLQFYLFCVCLSVRMCTLPQYAYGYWSKPCSSQFYPLSVWVLGLTQILGLVIRCLTNISLPLIGPHFLFP